MLLHSNTHNCRRQHIGPVLCCLSFAPGVLLCPVNAAGTSAVGPDHATTDVAHRLLAECWTPEQEFDPQSPIWVGITITNIGGELITDRLPYAWRSRTKDYFDLLHNGAPVENLVSKKDFGYKKVTALENNESVSVMFRLGSMFDVPTDPRERIGRYELRLKKVADSKGKLWLGAGSCEFWVTEKRAPVNLGITEVRTDHDLNQAILLMKGESLTPEDNLTLLKMALPSRNPSLIWSMIRSCDDAYALIEFLDEIPEGLIDSKALGELLQSADLSVRRAALQKMKRLPESKQNRPMLRDFLETQSDDIIREWLKQILLG